MLSCTRFLCGIGAAYGHAPTGGVNREVIGTIIGTLGLRYVGTGVVKLIPIVGSAVGGVFSGAATLLIGEAAIRYYEAGGMVPPAQFMQEESSVAPSWLARWRKWPSMPKFIRANREVQIIPIDEAPADSISNEEKGGA